jgi:hypothetical protein
VDPRSSHPERVSNLAPAVASIVERAGRLTEAEVRRLGRHYRSGPDPDAVGIQDPAHQARRRRWSNVLRTAVARGQHRDDARILVTACDRAVRAALVGSTSLGTLDALGLIDDAVAATANAALAIVLRDRLGTEEANDLAQPWFAVVGEMPEAVAGLPGVDLNR